jgi:hypothetical protein
VSLQIVFDENSVTTQVYLSLQMFNALVEDEMQDPSELSEGDLDEFATILDEILSRPNPLRIDGVLLSPRVEISFLTAGRSSPDAVVKLIYDLDEKPERVSVTWGTFGRDYFPADLDEGFRTRDIEEAPAIIKALDEPTILHTFTVDEPEYVWVAGAKKSMLGVAPVVDTGTIRTSFPFLALAVIVIALFALTVLVVLSNGKSPRRGRLVGIIVLYLALYGVAFRSYVPWSTAAPLPESEELVEIFEKLLRNIYRAFEASNAEGIDEDAIFDALSQSVSGPILGIIYNEIFESLVWRDEGGVLSAVRAIDIQNVDILPRNAETPAEGFAAHAKWTVDAYVKHQGMLESENDVYHAHSRLNEYEAIYTIVRLDGTWKIVGQVTLTQKRVSKTDLKLDSDQTGGEKK